MRLREAVDIVRKLSNEKVALERTLRDHQREHDTAEKIRKEILGLSEYTPDPPKWLTGRGVKHGERGGPVLIVSDVHYGEVIDLPFNQYNAKIAAKRLHKLFTTTIDLCQNHMGRANVAYPGIVLCLGGDLIGGDIHEELMMTNDRTPPQAVNELTSLLAGGIKLLADFFGRVFVVSVVGNHGRLGKKLTAKKRVFTNFDWSIACNLERHFCGFTDPMTGNWVKGSDPERVQFMTPNDADAYFHVYGTRFLLTHGDSLGVKGGDGIIGALGPIARGTIKIGNSERQIGRDIDYVLGCHYHQLLWLPNAIFNGCVKGYDEYARLNLRAPFQPPQQALFFVHPEHGLTARWPVFLEQRKATDNTPWVSWQKTGVSTI